MGKLACTIGIQLINDTKYIERIDAAIVGNIERIDRVVPSIATDHREAHNRFGVVDEIIDLIDKRLCSLLTAFQSKEAWDSAWIVKDGTVGARRYLCTQRTGELDRLTF